MRPVCHFAAGCPMMKAGTTGGGTGTGAGVAGTSALCRKCRSHACPGAAASGISATGGGGGSADEGEGRGEAGSGGGGAERATGEEHAEGHGLRVCHDPPG